MGALFWAVALSVLSAASYATAAVAQERLAEHGHRGLARWALALLLTAGGVALHLIALDFGTVAVVQALGTLTLLFALPISIVRYHTKIGAAGWTDAILTVAGLALILSLSVESDAPALLSDTTARWLAVITLGTVLVLTVASWPSGPRARAVLLAAAAGVAFGIGSVMSKAVIAEIGENGLGSVSWLIVGVIVVLSASGYLLGQFSYQGAGLAAPLATVSVTNPVVAAVAGIVVFNESFRHGLTGQVAVALAAVVMTLGVIGLARRSAPPPAQTSAPGDTKSEPQEGKEDRVTA